MDQDTTQPTPAAPTEATTDAATPAEDAAPEAAAEATPQAPVFDLAKALDEAPVEELRRHPKFAGIVGSEKQRWQQQYEHTRQAADEAAARAKAEEELRELAERNPVAFADKWLSSEEAKRQQDRVRALEITAQQQAGTAIGAAFHAIPEWAEIIQDGAKVADLTLATQGKAGFDSVAAMNAKALDLIANARAEKLAEQRLAERIKAERAAWETEAAAQGFRVSDRPDLVRAGRSNGADPEPDYLRDPKAWDAWWSRNK